MRALTRRAAARERDTTGVGFRRAASADQPRDRRTRSRARAAAGGRRGRGEAGRRVRRGRRRGGQDGAARGRSWREAAEAGARVLRARPTAAEAASSFAALRRSAPARDRGAAAARRSRSGARWRRRCCSRTRVDPVDPRLVGLACLSLLEALPGRVLLAVDDWQWLDAASAAVLSFVLRRLEPGGAKVIATVRQRRGGRGRRRARPRPARGPGARARGRPARPGRARASRPRAHRDLDGAARARPSPCGVRGNPLMALELVRAPGAEAATRHPPAARRAASERSRPRPGRCCGSSRRWRSRRSRPSRRRSTPAGGLEEALAADVLVRDGSRLRFSHPLIGGGGGGAHAARRVARDPRPARRADGPAGAARTPSRRRRGRARRSRGGGARGGGRRGGGARRDDGGRASWRSAPPS